MIKSLRQNDHVAPQAFKIILWSGHSDLASVISDSRSSSPQSWGLRGSCKSGQPRRVREGGNGCGAISSLHSPLRCSFLAGLARAMAGLEHRLKAMARTYQRQAVLGFAASRSARFASEAQAAIHARKPAPTSLTACSLN